MEFSHDRSDETLVINASGRVDGSNASDFLDTLQGLFEPGDQQIILDLGGLEYISSAGLRVLLMAAQNLDKDNKSFSICSLTDSVSDVFRISGFDQIIKVFPTVDAAKQG
ncbi:MAG: STAS domain-containing protein [Acidimicrobiia bacterium]|nr:STAS domain-containing protein [Acidimicrobiia bacterium]MYC57050.1 STAS domain-containing protein [Acidimicrobiia bacterium]MYI30127.1 STAS domain-containing protein [Acidimicrobiia bacterium]